MVASYVAMSNFTLTNEIDDDEWTDGHFWASSGVDRVNAVGQGAIDWISRLDPGIAAVAYRCWIPN